MIVTPMTKQLRAILGSTAVMIHRNNLSKLFPRAVANDLLAPCGGAYTPAYFQYQHLHLHHNQDKIKDTVPGVSFQTPSSCRQIHCSCSLQNGHSHGRTDAQSSSSSQDIKSKLETLKEKLAKNAYFEKYKEKFQQLEQTSPRDLLLKLEQLDARISAANQYKHNSNRSSQSKGQSKDEFVLNDVMALDRIKSLDREDIMFLWQEFHRNKMGVLGVVMAGAVFDKMVDLASQYPLFLMPLPRQDGYEFMFVQYMNKAFHFTPLLVYQTHKENAPECLRLINYTDLQSSKDLVLMRGEFDKNLLTAKDAHILAVQVNFYYGEISEYRTKLLESFTRKPDAFNHMDLIDELKKIQESHPHLFEE